MSTSVLPTQLYVYKVVRDYEKTGKTLYSKKELLKFAQKVVSIASVIDSEDYWIFPNTEYGFLFEEAMSKICDTTQNYIEINESKFNNGGKEWAEKIIGSMPYSFLKGAVKVLEEELKEKYRETLCD